MTGASFEAPIRERTVLAMSVNVADQDAAFRNHVSDANQVIRKPRQSQPEPEISGQEQEAPALPDENG